MTWGVVVGEEALGRACVQGEVQGDLVVDKWINGRRRGQATICLVLCS